MPFFLTRKTRLRVCGATGRRLLLRQPFRAYGGSKGGRPPCKLPGSPTDMVGWGGLQVACHLGSLPYPPQGRVCDVIHLPRCFPGIFFTPCGLVVDNFSSFRFIEKTVSNLPPRIPVPGRPHCVRRVCSCCAQAVAGRKYHCAVGRIQAVVQGLTKSRKNIILKI